LTYQINLHASQWHVSYPINNYNVTVNIAKYAYFTEKHPLKDGSQLDLQYYVLSYNLEQSEKTFSAGS